jgi:hypothetical protein
MAKQMTKSTKATARAKPAKKGLSKTELAKQQGSELPDREAMSLVNANLAVPINAAVAANVLSDGAIAAADAQQNTPIQQGIGGLPGAAPAPAPAPAP